MEDLSASGFQEPTYESVSSHFSQMEILGTHGHNILARAKRYGRWYLLKGIAPEYADEEIYKQMLSKEFDIMIRMQHPGIVQAINMEEVDNLGKCIVMEWVEGTTMKQWIEGETSHSEREIAAHQLLDALSYIHGHGIAHRDIKPSNIMITSNGHNVKIIDFGLADTDTHAILKQPAGTEHYMAPEQASTSKPDVRNDIYSLGLVLRDMNLGKHYKAPIARCLMPIAERYQSVDELKTDLQRRESRRKTIAIGLTALGLAGLIGLTAVIAIHLNKRDANKIYVTDNKARQQVDSLRNMLSQTTIQMKESQNAQLAMQSHLGGLNDTISSLNNANSALRAQQIEREARQIMVDNTIAEGISIINAANAATHLKHHIDTLSNRNYVWIDWHYQSIEGRRKVPEFMNSIRNKFTPKELSEIEYSLTEHCNNYENNVIERLIKKGVNTSVVE